MPIHIIEEVTCKACGNSWPKDEYEELRPVDASIGYCPSCGEDGLCEEVEAIDDGMKQCPFEKACRCVMDEPCEYCETKCEYDKRRRRETIEECVAAVDALAYVDFERNGVLVDVSNALYALKEA